MAIPMFILAGNLLSKGSAATRIIEFAKSIVGHLPGGLPISAIFASIIFAAVSGSSPATVVAIGSIMFGAIMQAGYPKKYAVGTIATAGSLGILIPPSIVLIVFGVTAEVSIGRLFMAGVVPGIMLGLMMMVVTYIGAVRLGFKRTEPAPFKERLIKDERCILGTYDNCYCYWWYLWWYIYSNRSSSCCSNLGIYSSLYLFIKISIFHRCLMFL